MSNYGLLMFITIVKQKYIETMVKMDNIYRSLRIFNILIEYIMSNQSKF